MDDKLTLCLDLTEDYLQLQKRLAGLLKEAHIQLAQAKYAVGPARVGQSQYDANMQASFRVPVEAAVNHSDPGAGGVDEGAPRTEAGSYSSQITELAVKFACSSTDDALPDRASQAKQKDPMQWFGVMRPHSLKTAQAEFKSAACVVLELAATQHKLCQLLTDLKAFAVQAPQIVEE